MLPPDPAAERGPRPVARPARRAGPRRRRGHRPVDLRRRAASARRRARCRSATRSRSRSRRGAMERDLPFLGVCRGMQVMNVARGGTLIQHLPGRLGHEDHRPLARARSTTPTTTCGWRDGSLAARAAGERSHATKSHHHQGVDRIGDGLEVTGLGDDRRPARGDRGCRAAGSRSASSGIRRPTRHVAADRRARRGGARVPRALGGGRVTLTVLEPATEQVLDELPRAGVEEVDAAVARAKAAYPAWRAVSPGRPRAAAAPARRRARARARGAGGARGAQRRQADRRRARRDGHGRRHVPLLRRRGRAAARRHDPGRRRRRDDVPRAARRGRADHAVELPARRSPRGSSRRRSRPATRSCSSPPS